MGAEPGTVRGPYRIADCHPPPLVDRLTQLAAYIARNLPFVQQVALMGLEPIGFAQHNLQAL